MMALKTGLKLTATVEIRIADGKDHGNRLFSHMRIAGSPSG